MCVHDELGEREVVIPRSSRGRFGLTGMAVACTARSVWVPRTVVPSSDICELVEGFLGGRGYIGC